jgi:hypothetical protein
MSDTTGSAYIWLGAHQLAGWQRDNCDICKKGWDPGEKGKVTRGDDRIGCSLEKEISSRMETSAMAPLFPEKFRKKIGHTINPNFTCLKLRRDPEKIQAQKEREAMSVEKAHRLAAWRRPNHYER